LASGGLPRGTIEQSTPVSRINRDNKVSRQKDYQLSLSGLSKWKWLGDGVVGDADDRCRLGLSPTWKIQTLPVIDVEEPTLQLTFGE